MVVSEASVEIARVILFLNTAVKVPWRTFLCIFNSLLSYGVECFYSSVI